MTEASSADHREAEQADQMLLHGSDPETSSPDTARRRRKWLGRHGGWLVFGAFVVTWLATFFLLVMLAHDRRLTEYVFLVGGFATSGSLLYAMCYRLRPDDRLTPSFLIAVFAVGGFASGALTTFPDIVLGHGIVNQILVGPVEEFCKIVVVVVVARWVPVKNARTGLFIGGAVGFGFAAFENSLYAFGAYLDPVSGSQALNLVAETEALRSVTTLFGHPIWTAIIAAAVYAAYRDNRLRVTRRVVGAFLLAAGLHDLWDASGPIVQTILPLGLNSFLVEQVVLLVIGLAGVFIWWRMARRANSALTTQPALTGATLA